MTKYHVIYSDDLCELINIVNSYIEEGWIPKGGIMIVDNFRYKYFQAIYNPLQNEK